MRVISEQMEREKKERQKQVEAEFDFDREIEQFVEIQFKSMKTMKGMENIVEDVLGKIQKGDEDDMIFYKNNKEIKQNFKL